MSDQTATKQRWWERGEISGSTAGWIFMVLYFLLGGMGIGVFVGWAIWG